MPNKIQTESVFVFFSSSSPIHAEQDQWTLYFLREWSPLLAILSTHFSYGLPSKWLATYVSELLNIIFLAVQIHAKMDMGQLWYVSYRRETVEIVSDSNASVKTYCSSGGIQ